MPQPCIKIAILQRVISAAILIALFLPALAMAAPLAVDDNLSTPANTDLIGVDLSANDVGVQTTDTFTLVTQAKNGTTSVTSDGMLVYIPNTGFARTDTLTYSVTDTAGDSSTATVTIDVIESSDYISAADSVILAQEDASIPLNLSVDPNLYLGGSLQDIIDVDALYRTSSAGTTPVTSTIPSDTISIKVTGYATYNTDTAQDDKRNDDYQILSATVDLRTGTYSGQLNYNFDLSSGPTDQFSWENVPLGEAVLSDTSRLSGVWSGSSNPQFSILTDQFQISETIPLQVSYHIEYLTANGSSASFQMASGDVQANADNQSVFSIPPALEPIAPAKKGFIVLSGSSAANGAHFAEEHKGFSRFIVDLESGMTSGVLASEVGETDDRVTSWAFTDYPLIDLRLTPLLPTTDAISGSTNLIGDSVATSGFNENPTIYLDASGDLVVERDSNYANEFTTIYTSEYYERKEYNSIATFVSISSDNSLFETSPTDAIDENGKTINIQTFDVPETASVGIVQMSWNTQGGSSINENMGIGYAVIDLEAGSSSGSITFTRSTTPDLLAWQGVEFGSTMFGATDSGGLDIYQSNKSAGGFTDGYPETSKFTLVNNSDGSRSLEFTATGDGSSPASHKNYWGSAQIAWLGNSPFTISGAPVGGTFSHGSPADGGLWEVDYTDIPSLAYVPSNGITGSVPITITLDTTGETDSIQIYSEPVADAPTLTTADSLGYVDNSTAIDISVGDSSDTDGSETQLQTLTLSNVPTSITLSSNTGTVSSQGAGTWEISATALPNLVAIGTTAGTFTINVSGTNTDQIDLDGDTIFEDGDNGSGADEVDTLTVTDTFVITVREVPTVTAQTSNSGAPLISGIVVIGSNESFSVAVNGVTYTPGDGNLVVNNNGTWELNIPTAANLSDGSYPVTASLTHSDGSIGSDTSSLELIVDTIPPAIPSVNALNTNDTTPSLSGTATVASDESLTVTLNNITYTVGDGNLSYDGNANTWELNIPNTDELVENTYSVTATIVDAAGNSSSDASNNELLIDITVPAVPTVTAQSTNDTTPIILGTAIVASGETLSVTVDGITYTDGDGNLTYDSINNTWTLGIPTINALGEGIYAITSTVLDAAGNSSSDSTTNELLIDTTAPTVPTVILQNTSNIAPNISGTATVSPGETFTVTVGGSTYTNGDGNLAYDSNTDTWQLNIPSANSLSEGTYPVTTTVTDNSGNSSADTSSNELVIDTTAPAPPVVTAQNTNDTTPTILGTATAATGEILTVTVDGVTYSDGDGNLAYDNNTNTWELNVPVANAISEGSYLITATLTDPAGNTTSDTTSNELFIDTTAPNTPTVVAQTISNTTPTINGTATVSSDEVLTVTINGINYTDGDGNLSIDASGDWTLIVPASDALGDATYPVTATVTDAAGNATSDISSDELIVDTTSPAIPTVITQASNDTTPVISGTATVNSDETLSVVVDGITYSDGDGNLSYNNNGTWSLIIPNANALSEALYSVTASVEDNAGNTTSDTSTDELLVDTSLPAIPSVTPQSTNDTTPVISGAATIAANEQLTVTINGITYTDGDGNLLYNSSSNLWTLSLPASDSLAEGTYPVIATVTDTAGNISSDTSTDELIIDTAAPNTPIITAEITSDTTPVISGTATIATGEVLSVTLNGITYTDGDGNLIAYGNDTWALTIPDADALSEGTYSLTATLIDAAGNTSSDATIDELIIDTTAPVVPTVIAQNTSDTTPQISGTATVPAGYILTVSVDSVSYIAGDGDLVDNGDDSWTLDIPLANALNDGSYSVDVIVTDPANNSTSDTTSNELVIDTVAPIVPTVIAQATSSTSPSLSGTATVANDEILTVTVDGNTYTAGDNQLVDNHDGTWTLSIPAANALSDNIYPVTATVTDAAGNISIDTTTGELHVDTTAPAIPTVNALITNDTSPVIEGSVTVAADETLTVVVDAVTYTAGDGHLLDNGDGSWTLDIPLANVLNDGSYSVDVIITDPANNSTTDTTSNELVIDTVAPIVPTVIAQATSSTSPSLSGTATVANDEILTVTVDGNTYTAGDNQLIDNHDGTWTLSIPAANALSDNFYPVTATVTDAAGNISIDTTTDELHVDTTAPAIPTINTLITNDTSPLIEGSATVAADETLTVTVDALTYTAGDGHLLDNGDGTWELDLPVSLTEGTYPITATVTDEAGNTTSDATLGELRIDLTPPAAPGVTSLATSNHTPVIEGTATIEAGDTLNVTVNGISYIVGDGNLADNGNDTWTLTIPAADSLPDALYQVVATLSDIAGNSSSDPGVDDLLIDTSAPATPGVTSLTSNDTTPVISGTATLLPGETLTVNVNGVNYTLGDGNLVDNGDDTWTLSLPISLPEGNYDVIATLTDTAGNTSSDPSTGELLIDTTSPITPTVTPLSTNDTTPLLTGTAVVGSGETLTVTLDSLVYTAGDGNLLDNGDGSWTLSVPTPLGEGSYSVDATVTDAAGNTATDGSSAELTIDTTNPAIPTVTAQSTSDTSPTIYGTAQINPGEILSVLLDGISYIAGDGHLLDNGDGTWQLTVSSPLADARYDVVATITDTAGNSSTDTSSAELHIDTTSPSTPTASPQTSNSGTPFIAGTAVVAADEILTVTVDNVTYTAGDGQLVDNGDGTWELSLPNSLSDGNYPITVTVTDTAGNTSSNASTQELYIDTTAPVPPSVNALVTNNESPQLSGNATVSANEILSVTVDGTTYNTGDGNLVDNGDGTWSLNIPVELAEGSYDVTATVSDTAGNVSTDSSTAELLIDTTAPSAPTVDQLSSNSTTPVITGTAIIGVGDTLSITLDNTTYTVGDGYLVDNGDGTWNLSVPSPLSDGSYPLTVTVTSPAGNATSNPDTDELIIDTSAPAAPTVTPLVSNDSSPLIIGTATVNIDEILTVTLDGLDYTAGDGNLTDNGDGTWELELPVSLAEGIYSVNAVVTDAVGNATSDATTEELSIDLTSPVAPGVTSLATANHTPLIEGTANIETGEILSVTVNDINYIAGDGDLIDNGDSTWTLTIPSANTLPDALYQVVATVTDIAGNSSTDPSIDELLIDTTTPATPGVTSLTTVDTTPSIHVTATLAAGETLTVTVDGIDYTLGDGNLIDNGDDTWTLTIPLDLAEGSYDVTATVRDTAGNINTDPSTAELLIDTTAPSVPALTPLSSNSTTPLITGTAIIGVAETLSVTLDGTTYTTDDSYLVDNGDGTWSLSVPTPLAEGIYSVNATVTDAAGNAVTDGSNNELTVDTTAPATPTVTAQPTSDTTPVISGTVLLNLGETLSVTLDSSTYTVGDGNLFIDGEGVWTLSIPTPLAEGTYDIIATAIDTAGNSASVTAIAELSIDTTSPVTPTVNVPASNNSTPVITGTASLAADEILSVTLDNVTYTVGDGYLIDNGDGTWNLSVPNSLSDGSYPVTVTVTDAAGNATSNGNTDELVIDTSAPATPTVNTLVSSGSSPLITGTATVAIDEVFTVTINGVTYTAGEGDLIDNGDGTWELDLPMSLAEGSYSVTTTIIDAVGNAASGVTPAAVSIDLTAPDAPGVTSLATAERAPLIEGTANIGTGEILSVIVNDISYTAGDGNLLDNGDGTWALTIPAANTLPDALYQVVATITDIAGNSSTDPSIDELLIDTTAPATPGVTSLTTADTTPSIDGTATLAPDETLTVTVDGIDYTLGDGNLIDNGDDTWTLTVPLDLTEGSYDVTATVHDTAGNINTDPSSSELLVDTTSPSAPTINPLSGNDTTTLITGTAIIAAGDTFNVTVDGVSYTLGDGYLNINTEGHWELNLPALLEGSHEITASLSDAAGNTNSTTVIEEIRSETTPPSISETVTVDTSAASLQLSGTSNAQSGSEVSIVNSVGDLICETTVSNGSWSCTPPEALEAGSQQLLVSITDTSGNTANATVVIDIPETGEGEINPPGTVNDFDGDGVPNDEDLDADNDGIPDAIEGSRDSDGDGQPDYLDLDSDNDGIADIVEAQGEDSDHDYRVDNFVDRDNNGLSDDLQLFPLEIVDTDKDRIPDYLDLDSDNDGITDLLESGGVDDIYDGRIDGFTDANNDGADDTRQMIGPAGQDTDNDGIPNRLELDSDNDGINDVSESGADDDIADGINDPMLDSDQDGLPDTVDVDQTGGNDIDNDGIDDRYDASFLNDPDTDGDGIIDSADPDANGDGFADDPGNALTLGQALPDLDGNDIPDMLESNEGVLRTGLTGRGGCSVSGGSAQGTRDPFLAILIIAFATLWWRRRSNAQANPTL